MGCIFEGEAGCAHGDTRRRVRNSTYVTLPSHSPHPLSPLVPSSATLPPLLIASSTLTITWCSSLLEKAYYHRHNSLESLSCFADPPCKVRKSPDSRIYASHMKKLSDFKGCFTLLRASLQNINLFGNRFGYQQ